MISITLFSGELKAQDVEEDSVFVYFFKSVVIGKMINVKSKNIVAIPYYASPPNIYFEDYFKIAEKYYPRITRDSLIKVIDQGKVIDQDPLIEGYTINVLNDYGGKYDVYKNSNSNPYKPHIFISPISFFSKWKHLYSICLYSGGKWLYGRNDKEFCREMGLT